MTTTPQLRHMRRNDGRNTYALSREEEVRVFGRLDAHRRRLLGLSLQSPCGIAELNTLAGEASKSLPPAGMSHQAHQQRLSLEALLRLPSRLADLESRASPHWSALGKPPVAPADALRADAARFHIEANLGHVLAELSAVEIPTDFQEQLFARTAKRMSRAGARDTVRESYLRRRIDVQSAQINRIKRSLVAANQGLVYYVMKRYGNLGTNMSDLAQEGNIGLLRAIDRFDINRGYRFNTFAVWWIRQAARRALSNHSRTIRIPVHLQDTRHTMDRTRARLTLQLGRAPTVDEVCEESGIPIERLERVGTLCGEPVSLDAPLRSDSTATLLDLLSDSDVTRADESAVAAERKEAIGELMNDLSERERRVLSLRFGLSGGPERTVDEIGRALGVTRERARQILRKSLAKLRRATRRRDVDLG